MLRTIATFLARRGVFASLVVLWGLLSALGMGLLTAYSGTPGPETAVAARWPADSQLVRSSTLPTLLVFIHPRCPCSRATLGELAVLAVQCRGRFAAQVIFARPPDVESGWERTDLWDAAVAIPGVTASADDDEREASRFHAATSGHALLYSPDGRLLFSGGITHSRGHAGDNEGRSVLTSLLSDGSIAIDGTPVYGCPLFNPEFETSTDSPPCRRN